MRRMFYVNTVIISALIFLLSGCYTHNTVKSSVKSPKFQQENEPRRILRVVVITEDDRAIPNERYEKKIKDYIKRSSKLLDKQTGMQYEISHWVPVVWKIGFDPNNEPDLLDRLIGLTRSNKMVGLKWDNFDIGVFFSKSYFGPEAASDTRVRRFIIIRQLNEYALIKETSYLFGCPYKRRVPIHFPFIIAGVPINMNAYLSPEDRAVMLKNKWRDFTKPLEKPRSKAEKKVSKKKLTPSKEFVKDATTKKGLYVVPLHGRPVWIDSRNNPKRVFVFINGIETLLGEGEELKYVAEEEILLLDGKQVWPKK